MCPDADSASTPNLQYRAGGLLPSSDLRAHAPHTLDTARVFTPPQGRYDWRRQRDEIRRQILVSCGLLPLPARTPLKPRVFHQVQRDGYTVEKVALQTHPGFYLCGNLYRPAAGEQWPARTPPYPGVLVAHGHWPAGRLQDGPTGSIPARAITFARQGYIAFTYDMVGYNDTRQIPHTFANTRAHWLHGISLMGLQTWNSMRALDFLESLPDVDHRRLAITGESGGGTQTMILAAVDDRIAASAPCVMVSHTMQGGCLCENAPGLRIDFSNVDIAAAAAPRAQIMVGASGDWTSTIMTMEGPSVALVYSLLSKRSNLDFVIFDAPHNINLQSREAVYAFFGAHLLRERDPSRLKEPPYQMEPAESLRVFPDGAPLPAEAKSAEELTSYLIGAAESQREPPRSHEELRRFHDTWRPVWESTLALDPTPLRVVSEVGETFHTTHTSRTGLALGRPQGGDRIRGLLVLPQKRCQNAMVVVLPEGLPTSAGISAPGTDLAEALARLGFAVLAVEPFLTDPEDQDNIAQRGDPFDRFFTTYNRTLLQERVQDATTAVAYMRQEGHSSVGIAGVGRAGLWALLAGPSADAVIADCGSIDLTADDALLQDELFTPGLRRMGDFATAGMLAAPRHMLLHNTGERFQAAASLRSVYSALDAANNLKASENPASLKEIAGWAALHILSPQLENQS